MDAELAASVIDDAFQALGTPGCRYEPPAGPDVTDLILIRHRRSGDRTAGGLAFGRGEFTTTERPQAIVVRRSDVALPLIGGVFVLPRAAGPEVRARIGEDPVEDDIHGFAWRCSVELL